jgi:hypothetical protein
MKKTQMGTENVFVNQVILKIPIHQLVNPALKIVENVKAMQISVWSAPK